MNIMRYKLTLEAVNCGSRRFEAECEAGSQELLGLKLAYDIAKAIAATLQDPPSAMAIAKAMGCEGAIGGMAYAFNNGWTGEYDFDECVEVVVDVAKLTKHAEPDDVEITKRVLNMYGVTLKE